MRHLSLLLLLSACGESEPTADAGPIEPPHDAGPPPCGTAHGELPDDLTELAWDDDTIGTSPYTAMDLSFMTAPYNGGAVPSSGPFYEAVRFELERPATIYAVKVRLTAVGNLREDDEHSIGIYGDFGNNGFDFDRWNPLWTGSRCGEDIPRDEWVTYVLPEPIQRPAGLVYGANHRVDQTTPRMVFAENRAENCDAWDNCHSAWNFPELDDSAYNGPSFPLPYNYAMRMLVRYEDPLPEDSSVFVDRDELRLSNRSAWADYDGDGWTDVLVNGLKLYRNIDGQRFEDVTDAAGLSGVGGTGIWGDLDNDGCLDIVAFGGRERLFSGDCAGNFVERTEETGIDDRQRDISCRGEENEHASTMAVALVDYNGDGLLDVYIANGECWRDNRGLYYKDKVYRNEGNWSFRDRSERDGFAAIGTYSRAIAPADVNGDGLTDLLVGNYRLQRNFLFMSEGDTVRERGIQNGIAGDNVSGAYGHAIGATFTDLNGDEHLDLIIGNLAHPRFYHFSDLSKVYLGSATGRFEDVSEGAGLRFQETHSVPAAGDFNNDGLVDLAITAVYPGRPTDFYWGLGDGVFADAAYGAGITTENGWGAVVVDADNDGSLDLALDRLYRGRHADGHWLQVRALGGDGVNAAGIGARIRVEAGELSALRNVSGCNGQGGQDALTAHMGLADQGTVDRITVWYPGRAEPVVIEGPIDADQKVWVFADGSHGFGWTQP